MSKLILASIVALTVTAGGCARRGIPGDSYPVLLFDGAGTSPSDVEAVATVLRDSDVRYATVNSAELNTATADQLRSHRLLIVAGGNFVDMGNGLTPAATTNIRDAVAHGLNYLGICGGGFLAGHSPYNGLNLTSGVRFGFYAAEARGIRKAAVPIAIPGHPTLEQYWEDGPELGGWGTPVATYPDGTPATAEGAFGRGWVVLTGVHPEAPENWRRGMTFTTPARADHAYAAMLVRAALDGISLLNQ